MTKFCTNCEQEMTDNATFCTECGHTLQTESKVIGTGKYFALMLLFAIPIVGFITCIIMTFASKNKNIRNFARATLIWIIIAFILSVILIAIISVLANTLTDYINQMTNGQFGEFSDFISQFNEFKDSMSDFGNITEQLPTNGLEGLPLE